MKLVTIADHCHRKNLLLFDPRKRGQTTAKSDPSKVCTTAPAPAPIAQYHKTNRVINHSDD